MLETRDNILLELHKLYDLFFKALGVEAPPPGFGTRLGIVPHAVIKSEGAAEGGFPGASTSAAAPVLTENTTRTVIRFDKKVWGQQSNFEIIKLSL